MAITAPKPPEQPGTRDILEAIQELRRHFDDRMDRFDERLRKVETDVARVDGRLGELSARVPTIWTLRMVQGCDNSECGSRQEARNARGTKCSTR